MATEYADKAARLKDQFNEQFWMPDRGYYAVALDGKKRQVDACASNMGHCLVYGFIAEAQRISTALLEAAEYSGGRLPELFCGFSRDQIAEPVPYPTACSPQAWAATTPIRLVTNLMRYDTHVSLGGVWVDPVLPESYGDLHISNAPLAGGRITIDIAHSVPSVQGLPEGMELRQGRRPYLTQLLEQAGLDVKGVAAD